MGESLGKPMGMVPLRPIVLFLLHSLGGRFLCLVSWFVQGGLCVHSFAERKTFL